MKRIFAKEEYCVGCRLCQVYCAAAHSPYKDDLVKAFKNSPSRPLPRVVVEEQRPLSFAVHCRHCEEAACVKACLTGAMQKNPETGAVILDESRCIGCWTCVLACPHGAIIRDVEHKKAAGKCDLCCGLATQPVCVENCPNGALVYEEDINRQDIDKQDIDKQKGGEERA
jgi:carbon-monoxide dehydrogenase iron sulfur subunit